MRQGQSSWSGAKLRGRRWTTVTSIQIDNLRASRLVFLPFLAPGSNCHVATLYPSWLLVPSSLTSISCAPCEVKNRCTLCVNERQVPHNCEYHTCA